MQKGKRHNFLVLKNKTMHVAPYYNYTQNQGSFSLIVVLAGVWEPALFTFNSTSLFWASFSALNQCTVGRISDIWLNVMSVVKLVALASLNCDVSLNKTLWYNAGDAVFVRYFLSVSPPSEGDL